MVTPLVLNKLFFPTHDPIVGTLLAYTTFFVGFFSRPIGGIIFGHFGDRIGRKTVLILTLLIMGIATFLIGLCRPTNDRNLGANPAGSVPYVSGDRRRRRVGRRGADGDRAFAAGHGAASTEAGRRSACPAGLLLSAGAVYAAVATCQTLISSPGAGASHF